MFNFTEEFTNNRIELSGRFVSLKLSFTNTFGRTYAEITINSTRNSGVIDVIPTIVPIWEIQNFNIGDYLYVEGEIRSLNFVDEDGKSHLKIYVHALRLRTLNYLSAEDEMHQEINEAEITGYLVKSPVYRETPFGRKIANLLVATHRHNGRSDYLPCIVWGKNARFANYLQVGDCVTLSLGRFQSRQYVKLFPDGEEIEKMAFEISFGLLRKNRKIFTN